MPKSTFIPNADHDFLIWLDHFIANLTPEYGVLESDLNALKAASADFRAKTAHANDVAALGKQATADKNASRAIAEALIRAEVRRIKARSDYTEGKGAHLGIEGPENTYDLSTAHPDLTGIDQTGGVVALSFSKYKSDGINIYCQRENDADWVLLARATVSPYLDNRPLLHIGKPELRRYTAVYMLKDKEIGQYSDDIVINCAP
ncbi:MAG: hypothetical protein PHO08_01935 [Methylococcales bacterium]|nr:hypothetical protein [Methylococcales bacterium]